MMIVLRADCLPLFDAPAPMDAFIMLYAICDQLQTLLPASARQSHAISARYRMLVMIGLRGIEAAC